MGKFQQQVIRDVKHMIEEMETLVKENVDSKVLLPETLHDFWDTKQRKKKQLCFVLGPFPSVYFVHFCMLALVLSY